MELPGAGGVAPIRFGVAVSALGAADNLRFTVAGEVGERRRFVVGHIENDVLLPMTFAALRVLIPGGDITGETENQNVVPAVLVEIAGEGKKVVRISVVAAERPFKAVDGLLSALGVLFLEGLRRRIIFVAFLEVRPFIPERARNDVPFAVVVEVAEVRALAPELVAEPGLLKGVQKVIFAGDHERARQSNEEGQRKLVHGLSLSATVPTVKLANPRRRAVGYRTASRQR